MDESFTSNSGSGDAPPPYLGGQPSPAAMSERMQSLLSRAVEDQMNEQRQLQNLIKDVRQSLAQLQEEVRNAAGAQSVEGVRTEVGTLGNEVRSSTTMLGERLEAVARAVGASAQALQNLGGQIDRVSELLAGNQQSLAQMSAAVSQVRTSMTDAGGPDVATLIAENNAALIGHIDAAVLTLAEALLRRRPAAAVAPVVSSAEVEPETAPAAVWHAPVDDEAAEAVDSDEGGSGEIAAADAPIGMPDEVDEVPISDWQDEAQRTDTVESVDEWQRPEVDPDEDADTSAPESSGDEPEVPSLAPEPDADTGAASTEPAADAAQVEEPQGAPAPAYGGWGQPAAESEEEHDKRRPWWRPGG